MNFRNCYAIKEENNIRKILIEISEITDSSVGSNFYEITARKTSSETYELVGIDIVERPFEYFQELVQQRKVKKVNISEEKIKKLFSLLNYEFLNNKIKIKEFNYIRNDNFYKRNGININPSKKLTNPNKRNK